MRLDLHVSPELYSVIRADAQAKGVSVSAAIRAKLSHAYGQQEKIISRFNHKPRVVHHNEEE